MDFSRPLTKTCQTFSFALSKLQKRMLTPTSPRPPHMLLGTMVVSLTASVLLLYNSILMGLSMFMFSSCFKVSLSLFYKNIAAITAPGRTCVKSSCCEPTSLVSQMEMIKSKNGSSPAWCPGELSWTCETQQHRGQRQDDGGQWLMWTSVAMSKSCIRSDMNPWMCQGSFLLKPEYWGYWHPFRINAPLIIFSRLFQQERIILSAPADTPNNMWIASRWLLLSTDTFVTSHMWKRASLQQLWENVSQSLNGLKTDAGKVE